MSSSEWLDRSFEIPCRLLARIGGNIFDHRWQPTLRSIYPCSVMLLAAVEILYLFYVERSNAVNFLMAFQNAMVVCQAVHMVIVGVQRREMFRKLSFKMMDIQNLLGHGGKNGLILAEALRLCTLIQKLMFLVYVLTSMAIILVPIMLLIIQEQKTLVMIYFVPGIDGSSLNGFLLNLVLQSIMLPVAICVYVSLECIFLALIIPVGAYVDAFGNEISELNSALTLSEHNDAAVHDQLKRIVKLHQLLNEYESMLQELYSSAILVKIGLVYLGIISAIVVIFKSDEDYIAYIYLVLQFEHLTRYCMMGAIITNKNEQLLEHIADINWYQLNRESKHLILMLLQAQNATGMTIGELKPLNAESYSEILNSIYSYVMVLNAVLN